MLANHPLITASDRLYFAYGSNLSPEQMARRCPDSIFLGKATLRGHKWQINERGVANVVPVPTAPAPAKKGKGGRNSSSSSGRGRSRDHQGDDDHAPVVEGLLYALSAADERRLDRYEGVAKGWYEKFGVQVDFEPVRGNVFARCTSASVARAVREEREQDKIADVLGVERRARSWDEGEKRRGSGRRDGGAGGRRGASVGASSSTSSSSSSSSSSSLATGSGGLRSSILGLLGIPTSSKTGRTASESPSPSPARGRERAAPTVVGTPVVAIVYASTAYVRDGEVKERYVPRMERAVADAVALGVSRGFVEEYIAPRVFRNRPDWGSAWRKSLAAGGEDGTERDKGRRGVESARRSTSQFDGSGRRGRCDSVLDRSRDY